jgi:hypothetical protein
MQIKGHAHEATLRGELNSVLAGITATLRAVISKEEEVE